jgi:hypothetical protein
VTVTVTVTVTMRARLKVVAYRGQVPCRNVSTSEYALRARSQTYAHLAVHVFPAQSLVATSLIHACARACRWAHAKAEHRPVNICMCPTQIEASQTHVQGLKVDACPHRRVQRHLYVSMPTHKLVYASMRLCVCRVFFASQHSRSAVLHLTRSIHAVRPRPSRALHTSM